MWPWLRSERFKNLLTDRQQFLIQLCLFSGVVHIVIVVLSIVVFGKSCQEERFVISAKNHNTVYVLSPFKKQIKSTGKSSGNSSSKASKVINYDTYQALKKQKNKISVPVQKKQGKSSSVTSSKTTTPLANQASVKKKDSSKIALKKPQLTISQASLVEKKSVDSKKKITTEKCLKNESKKEDLQKETVVDKSIGDTKDKMVAVDKVLEHESKDAVEKIIDSQQVSQSINQDLLSQQDDLDIDNVTFIGYEQLDSLAVQNKIQQTVQQHFKSPVGMQKDITCELSVMVGNTGKAHKVTIVRSSGVLMYDMSARGTMQHIEFPKEVWNKTVTIVLGQ